MEFECIFENQPWTYAGGVMAKYEMSLLNVYADVHIWELSNYGEPVFVYYI